MIVFGVSLTCFSGIAYDICAWGYRAVAGALAFVLLKNSVLLGALHLAPHGKGTGGISSMSGEKMKDIGAGH